MSISLSCLKSQIKGNDCKVINMTFIYSHGCLGTKCLDSEWKPKTEIRFHYSPGCDSTLSVCLHILRHQQTVQGGRTSEDERNVFVFLIESRLLFI